MKKRIATHAVDLKTALPIVGRLLELGEPATLEMPPYPSNSTFVIYRNTPPAERMLKEGRQYSRFMLSPTPTTATESLTA